MRMREKANYEIVKASGLGTDLDDFECKVLADIMLVEHLTDNEVLVGEGEQNHALFLLAEGSLTVTSMVNGIEDNVYTMKAGECAGTRAFIDREPRRVTLRAEGSATVYCLEPVAFENMLCAYPRLVYHVMRSLFRITHLNLMRMNIEADQLKQYIGRFGSRAFPGSPVL